MNINTLKAVLSTHKMSNPILSVYLEKEFDCSGAEIRNQIREMRRSGVPIGACADGYFWAETYSEIVPTIDDLKSRMISLSITARKLGEAFNVDIQTDLFGGFDELAR